MRRAGPRLFDRQPDVLDRRPSGHRRLPHPGNPIAFSNIERFAPGVAPRLGENTDEILSEIGYADGEIAKLRDDCIVAGPS